MRSGCMLRICGSGVRVELCGLSFFVLQLRHQGLWFRGQDFVYRVEG
jgi:hypothetical protein